jgi:transcriptional regulator with XRE-family HTH domain
LGGGVALGQPVTLPSDAIQPEKIGPLLVRLRNARGWSQIRLAERLCDASGIKTISRHEVSRWERQERIPSVFWLRWFAIVFDVPMDDIEAAAIVARNAEKPSVLAARSGGSAGTSRVPATPVRRTTQSVATSRPPGPSNGPSLSRVMIEFEHRTTSVRLSATYDDPGHALSTIGAFRSMLGASEPTGRRPEQMRTEPHYAGTDAEANGRGAVTNVPRQSIPLSQQRHASTPMAAPTAGQSGTVPMGIRYTTGPGSGQTRTRGNSIKQPISEHRMNDNDRPHRQALRADGARPRPPT